MPSSRPSVEEQVHSLLETALSALLQAQNLMATHSPIEHIIALKAKSAPAYPMVQEMCPFPVERISLPRIGRSGTKGAKILLRLMDEPDHYVSHGAIADAAELRSRSSDAIKVYICLIRNALEDAGYSPRMIETGRRSYRVRKKDMERLMDFFINL